MSGNIMAGTPQGSGQANWHQGPRDPVLPVLVGAGWDEGEEEPWEWMGGDEFRLLTEVKRRLACGDTCLLAAPWWGGLCSGVHPREPTPLLPTAPA